MKEMLVAIMVVGVALSINFTSSHFSKLKDNMNGYSRQATVFASEVSNSAYTGSGKSSKVEKSEKVSVSLDDVLNTRIESEIALKDTVENQF